MVVGIDDPQVRFQHWLRWLAGEPHPHPQSLVVAIDPAAIKLGFSHQLSPTVVRHIRRLRRTVSCVAAQCMSAPCRPLLANPAKCR
jgi:hypothetical protein